jgi:hypothetical protein
MYLAELPDRRSEKPSTGFSWGAVLQSLACLVFIATTVTAVHKVSGLGWVASVFAGLGLDVLGMLALFGLSIAVIASSF